MTIEGKIDLILEALELLLMERSGVITASDSWQYADMIDRIQSSRPKPAPDDEAADIPEDA